MKTCGSDSLFCRSMHRAVIATVLCAFPLGSFASPLRVTGSQVNLRAAPDPRSEVVGQLSVDSTLTPTGQQEGEWIQVEPPADAAMWVYSLLVKDGIVQTPKLQVRAGPGINYRTLGSLSKNDAVTVRKEAYDWLKIEPPSHCHVWIHSDFVQSRAETASAEDETPTIPIAARTPPPATPTPPPPARRAPARTPPSRPAPARRPPLPAASQEPTRQTEPSPSPQQRRDSKRIARAPVPAGLRMASDMDQGQAVTLAGRLRASKLALGRPSRYRLIGPNESGRLVTLAYVVDARTDLDVFLDRDIHVAGKQYWVVNARLPVLAADRIQAHPRR